MRVTLLARSLLVLLALVAGTAFAQETFRIAIGVDPDTLDPVQGTTTTVDNIVDYVAETLVAIDKDGKLTPALATSWQTDPDGLGITFTLRQDVTFHDGTPFDATAAQWNLERLLDPDVRVPRRGTFTAIESVEVTGPHTIHLSLNAPAPYLTGALAMTTAAFISPASINLEGNSYQNITHPVGTGPYVFDSRQLGESIQMTRYEDYWGEPPYYQHVLFRIVPEATTRESLLLAGQADLIILLPTSDIPALQANPRTKVVLGPSDRTIFIAINTQKPILNDKRVRQALNYAVDKQAIIQGILFGAAQVMDAPMAPSLFGYQPIGTYEYDPERARQLLAEAGVEPGSLTLDFMSPTGRYVQDFAASQAIANYLRDVGINAVVRTMDWPTYIGTMTKPLEENTTQLHLLGWAPAFLDAAQQMEQFESSRHPPAGLATSFYTNPEVDRLIEQAGQETNPDKRQDLYAQASRIIWDDAPWIFLWVQSFPMVHSSKVTNIWGLPNEKFYAIYAHPTE
ncbi:MAG TPA: ABC transporter substrate-binding protein [Trueperaceae bacterium]